MKTIVGIIIILFVMLGAVLTIMALWGIHPISWTIVWKSGLTLGIIGITSILISILYYFFVKRIQ